MTAPTPSAPTPHGAARPASPPAPLEGPEHTNGTATSHLLTAEDLASRWQVPASQVYRLTRTGRLPVVKLGRYYRYRLQSIEEFEQGGGGATDG